MTDLFGDEITCHVPIKMDRSKTALLVIDMQYHDAHPDYGFNLAVEKIRPGSMSYFNQRNETLTVPTIKSLIKLFRKNQLRVVYLMLGSDYPDYRDWNARSRSWILQLEKDSNVKGIFWSGSAFYRIRDELKPNEGELIIKKKTMGAFNSSNIEEELMSRGIDSLVITGISTNACVETTARDAADRGFSCAIVDNGTCDYDEDMHRASLRAFKFNFGDVLKDENEVSVALFGHKGEKKIEIATNV